MDTDDAVAAEQVGRYRNTIAVFVFALLVTGAIGAASGLPGGSLVALIVALVFTAAWRIHRHGN